MNQTDYNTFIQNSVIEQIIDNDPYALPECEAAAREEMRAYLNSYDITILFENYNNFPHFKMMWIDITLYHLHARINPKLIPEIRAIRYADAIAFLKKINKGEISVDYPMIPTSDQKGFSRFGSKPKQDFDY